MVEAEGQELQPAVAPRCVGGRARAAVRAQGAEAKGHLSLQVVIDGPGLFLQDWPPSRPGEGPDDGHGHGQELPHDAAHVVWVEPGQGGVDPAADAVLLVGPVEAEAGGAHRASK
eukprot:11546267-Alexandrium_andersonii.AAC.1